MRSECQHMMTSRSTSDDGVRRIAAATAKVYPTEVAFGMATRSSIQQAMDRLSERRVQPIVAVPLFVSSWSSVITSTEWLLGLRSEMPEDYEMFAGMSHGHEGRSGPNSPSTSDVLERVKSSVPIRMTPALNRHPIVAGILADRAASISVPVVLSYGGIENRLRDRLKGLDFTMANQGLLPDTRIVDWVLDSARATAQ